MTAIASRLAWGWVAHLRSGGTTPWREWRVTAPEGAEREPRARFLPGAQQLELLRRLNQAGGTPAPLVDRVLRASAVGRGVPDLDLVAAESHPTFGPPPVEPEQLAPGELLRVAAMLLAEDLAARDDGPAATPPGRRPPRLRQRYRLVGDPWRADPVRRALAQHGRPAGGAGARVLVLGTDLATMLADAWSARSFSEGGPTWSTFLEGAAVSRRLPRRADLLRAARLWAEQVGRDRVEVVLDPAELPRLLRVRHELPGPPSYSADAIELARRVGEALALTVPAERGGRLLRDVLGPRLHAAPGAPLRVPTRHHDWVRRQALRIRDGVLEDGYAVHGDPATLTALPGDVPGQSGPDDSGVLALALRLLLRPPQPAGKGVR